MKVSSLLVLLFNTASLPSLALPHDCRCTYGEKCWPNAVEFAQLALRISQPFVYPVPPASVCYPPAGVLSGDCATVQLNQFNATWRVQQSGAAQWPNYQAYTLPNGTISACYANTTLGFPCEQGSIPVVGVDAHSTSDIQAAVKFAAKYNLRLVIKNTGQVRISAT